MIPFECQKTTVTVHVSGFIAIPMPFHKINAARFYCPPDSQQAAIYNSS